MCFHEPPSLSCWNNPMSSCMSVHLCMCALFVYLYFFFFDLLMLWNMVSVWIIEQEPGSNSSYLWHKMMFWVIISIIWWKTRLNLDEAWESFAIFVFHRIRYIRANFVTFLVCAHLFKEKKSYSAKQILKIPSIICIS